MKKFFLYVLMTLAVLGAIFVYVLYDQGVFDTVEPVSQTEMEPFGPAMKCEAGKCATGKCGAN